MGEVVVSGEGNRRALTRLYCFVTVYDHLVRTGTAPVLRTPFSVKGRTEKNSFMYRCGPLPVLLKRMVGRRR